MELPNKKYKVIYADPPWQYGAWGAESKQHRTNCKSRPVPFDMMSIKEICQLPVKYIADENCELYLWTTQKYLPQVFDVIREWGFQYKQTLIWCKKPMAGLGGAYTPSNEFLILARKGKKPKAKRILTTWFLVKRPHNKHSAKPAFFRDMITKVTDSPRIELFARERKEGWDAWGNEVPKDISYSLSDMYDSEKERKLMLNWYKDFTPTHGFKQSKKSTGSGGKYVTFENEKYKILTNIANISPFPKESRHYKIYVAVYEKGEDVNVQTSVETIKEDIGNLPVGSVINILKNKIIGKFKKYGEKTTNNQDDDYCECGGIINCTPEGNICEKCGKYFHKNLTKNGES